MHKRSFGLVISVLLITLAGIYFLEFNKDPAPQSAGLLNNTLPAIDLPLLKEGPEQQQRLTKADFEGRRVIVHFFASWCKYCREEHPVIKALGARTDITLFGVNIHDKREDSLNWLESEGDPYDLIGFDEAGETASAWGVMATPQTFVVDEKGIIIYQYSGSLTPERVREEILPLFGEAS